MGHHSNIIRTFYVCGNSKTPQQDLPTAEFRFSFTQKKAAVQAILYFVR